jgi:glycosyltransferase involved in cell wall biosynthesis
MTMTNDLVSVIIPVYNGAAFLKETLESVLAQDYPFMEVLVVDDGSTDGSVEIIRSFGQELTLVTQANAGVAAARNTGLRQSKGQYIALIDQDDLWTASKTNLQMAQLHARPELDYVLGRQRFFLQEGTLCPPWLKPEILNGDQTGYVMGAFLARRRAFDKVGFMDTQYRYADDVSWFFTAKDKGVPMMHMAEVVLHKRVHGDNASGNIRVIHRELLAVARQSVFQQRRRDQA